MQTTTPMPRFTFATDRLPPYSRDAERSVLGSMLRDNQVIADIQMLVSDVDFYMDAHQKLFRGIVALQAQQKPADLVTLGEWVKGQGIVEEIGGYIYIGELWDAAPTAANSEHYAAIVRDASISRRLIHAAAEILADGYDPTGPAEEMLEAAERKIFELRQRPTGKRSVTIRDAVKIASDEIEQRAMTGRKRGVATGLADVDEILCGLAPGELVIVGARPSVGKTSLAAVLALNASRAGTPVLFVSLEQRYIELGERFLVMESGVDGHLCRNGKLTEVDFIALSHARDRLWNLRGVIDDQPTQTMTRIAANVRRQLRRETVGMVLIDYLQLIEPEDKKVNREQQIASITRRAKLLARECNVPVVLLAQLNRGPEEGQGRRPRLGDLRESGAQEQDADVVILLWRPPSDNKDAACVTVEAIVAKNRNGRTGDCLIGFEKKCMRFVNFYPEVP